MILGAAAQAMHQPESQPGQAQTLLFLKSFSST